MIELSQALLLNRCVSQFYIVSTWYVSSISSVRAHIIGIIYDTNNSLYIVAM